MWNMKRTLVPLLAVGLMAAPGALAQEAQMQQPAAASPAPDPVLVRVGDDLRAVARIAALGKNLEDNRQVTLAILDSDIELIREPRPDGTYRWASLERVEGSRVRQEKAIERVHTEKELREITVTAPNAYRGEVLVPRKRNAVQANNRVFIRKVLVDSTGFDGKITHHEIEVNAWVNPGDSNGFAFPAIGRSVRATAELGVENGEKKAVAELALIQATLVDDPKGPHFPAVSRLLRIREAAAKKEIDRTALKTGADEALLALPGEFERRAAEVAAMEARRLAGGAGIQPGDATPEVVAAVAGIQQLLGGTLEDQTAGRKQIEELLTALRPPPPETAPKPQP